MNFNKFEKRLKKQTFRSIPSEWKEEILKVCEGSAGGSPAEIGGSADLSTRQGTSAWARFRRSGRAACGPPKWREWFWPSPIAWGALAVTWLIIIALNMAMPKPSQTSHVDLATLHAEAMRFLVAQRYTPGMENGM